jgi:hypothetical protein
VLIKLLVFTSLSALLLVSLRRLKHRFDPLEIVLHFLFTSYICQQFFFMLSSPYERLRVVEEYVPFWAVRMQYGIIFPVLLMWVLYFMRGSHALSAKVGMCFLWVAGGVGIEKMLLLTGILKSGGKSWYPSIDFVFSMIVLVCSLLFFENLPHILRKEKMMNDEAIVRRRPSTHSSEKI